MNQKDYKNIAGIIWRRNGNSDGKDVMKFIAKELADYFEREEKQSNKSAFGQDSHLVELKFNKQQFLKDCGVE